MSISLITFDKYVKKLKTNRKLDRISQYNFNVIDKIYVPIDPYYDCINDLPESNNILQFDRLSDEELNEKLSKYSPDNKVTLYGNIISVDRFINTKSCKIITIDAAKSFIMDGPKTTQEEYEKYISHRKMILKQYDNIIV